MENVRDQLLNAGVKHLKEFGYPDATRNNILTDRIYSAFFKRMLEGTIDDCGGNTLIVRKCNELIAEIK